MRCETAETQLNDIDKLMQKGMKLLLHWDNSNEPAEISISVSPETTCEGLKSKISQTTRISPSNQLLILKGMGMGILNTKNKEIISLKLQIQHPSSAQALQS